MERRYQVFISSTFWDLKDERREVMQALLQSDCIPAGMELFPASDEESWELIRSVIDDCDYYVVIVAGRYGTIDETTGLSFTEMEYQYALEQKKPIAAFLHSDPGTLPSNQCEATDDGKKKLAAFKELIAKKKAYKKWNTPDGLGYAVMQSIARLKKTRPGIGWVRGDQIPSEETTVELLRLRRVVEELEQRLADAKDGPPPGTEGFAQGDDQIPIEFSISYWKSSGISDLAWTFKPKRTVNEVFYSIGAHMLDEANEEEIGHALVRVFGRRVRDELEAAMKGAPADSQWHSIGPWKGTTATKDGVHTVVVQLFTLGLIAKSIKKRSIKDTKIYWSLTAYGQDSLMKLRAVRRPGHEFSDEE